MTAACTEAERERICCMEWAPAYAALCRLPASTPRGLRIKVMALLDEHENGESEFGGDLRRTIRGALPHYLPG